MVMRHKIFAAIFLALVGGLSRLASAGDEGSYVPAPAPMQFATSHYFDGNGLRRELAAGADRAADPQQSISYRKLMLDYPTCGYCGGYAGCEGLGGCGYGCGGYGIGGFGIGGFGGYASFGYGGYDAYGYRGYGYRAWRGGAGLGNGSYENGLFSPSENYPMPLYSR